jgi:hypothetical protein
MLGWLEWRWLGGIYSPQPPIQPLGQAAIDGRTGQCPVRQPRHQPVRVLMVLTVGALSSCGTEQSGAAPDRYYSLSGAPLATALTSARTILQCSCCRRPLESTVALASRCSVGAPDSPVNYSGAALLKPEGGKFRLVRPWRTRHCPLAHRTVRGAKPGFSSVSFCSFLLNHNLMFFYWFVLNL